MSKKLTYVLLGVLLAAILVGAYFGYQYLSENYKPQTPIVSDSQPEEPEDMEQTPEENTEEPLQTAPDFTVLNADGEEVKLSDFFGKPIVINFWATWCGPCKVELPAYDNISKKYADQVEFLMVNLTDGVQETVDGVKDFLEAEGYSFPVYYDTTQEAANTYGTYSIPMTVLVYADGTAAGYWVGAVEEEILEHYVNLLIKGDIHEDQAES